MDKFITNTLPQLLLISKIPREGKLTVKNGELDIYGGGILNWTIRTFTGEGKKATIIFLKDFYQNIRKAVTDLIKQNIKEDDPTTKNVRSGNLSAIIENLYTSLEGIKNLTGTYHDNPKTISDLEYIENHVIIPTIQFYLSSDEPKPNTQAMRAIKDDVKITGKKKVAKPPAPPPVSQPIPISTTIIDETRQNPFSLEEEASTSLNSLNQI